MAFATPKASASAAKKAMKTKTKASASAAKKAMKTKTKASASAAKKAMKTKTKVSASAAKKEVKTKTKASASAAKKAMKTKSKASASAAKKAMKTKTKVKAKNSEVAVGRWAKWRVFNGWKARTTGRLTKKDLKLNSRGRVVYKKLSANMKQRLQRSNIKTWYQSVKEARQALMLTGFVPVGGKTAAGKALLFRAKVIYYEKAYDISQRASEEVLSKQIGMKSPASPILGVPSPRALSSPEIIELPGSGSPESPQTDEAAGA